MQLSLVFVFVFVASVNSVFGRMVFNQPLRHVSDISSQAPVIGILTQDTDDFQQSYIAASYVKYLEAAGARVVPVLYDQPLDKLTTLFSQLNGLLFPGGGITIVDFSSTYMKAVFHLYSLVIEANSNGDYFPLWGTCMGFQELVVVTANSPSVLVTNSYDSENLPQPLNFTSLAKTSRLFGKCPQYIYDATATENIAMNNHHDGVLPDTFVTNPFLAKTFNVLSTDFDRAGKEYVSAIEGKSIPLFGVQFHPEKNSFEWTDSEDIPHSPNAVALCQYLAKFFVDEARQSTHNFPYDDLMLKHGIWNFPVTYTYPNSTIMQVYMFDKSSH